MGVKYLFWCPSCGYKTEVSGGKDAGMLSVVRTMTCHDCCKLVDVLIGAYGQEGKTEDDEFNKQLGRCPLCNGMNVDKWEEKRPCPKCKKEIIKGDIVCHWD